VAKAATRAARAQHPKFGVRAHLFRNSGSEHIFEQWLVITNFSVKPITPSRAGAIVSVELFRKPLTQNVL
jgi:hypothetical protein